MPSDLSKLVELGNQVARKRHPDYPLGIWFDNVRVHTIRCALTAENLQLPAQLEHIRQPLVRMLWIHDLPEVVTSLDVGFDTSAVVKEDQPDTAARIEETEKQAAKRILNTDDYALFEQFEQGRLVFEGKTNDPDPSVHPAGYGARIIDIGDAEMCFYHFLTAWLIHDTFDGRLPSDRPYRFTMNRYSTFLANCRKLSAVIPPELLSIYEGLLLKQIRYIVTRWSLVEQNKPKLVPHIAKMQVTHLRSLLSEKAQ